MAAAVFEERGWLMRRNKRPGLQLFVILALSRFLVCPDKGGGPDGRVRGNCGMVGWWWAAGCQRSSQRIFSGVELEEIGWTRLSGRARWTW